MAHPIRVKMAPRFRSCRPSIRFIPERKPITSHAEDCPHLPNEFRLPRHEEAGSVPLCNIILCTHTVELHIGYCFGLF